MYEHNRRENARRIIRNKDCPKVTPNQSGCMNRLLNNPYGFCAVMVVGTITILGLISLVLHLCSVKGGNGW